MPAKHKGQMRAGDGLGWITAVLAAMLVLSAGACGHAAHEVTSPPGALEGSGPVQDGTNPAHVEETVSPENTPTADQLPADQVPPTLPTGNPTLNLAPGEVRTDQVQDNPELKPTPTPVPVATEHQRVEPTPVAVPTEPTAVEPTAATAPTAGGTIEPWSASLARMVERAVLDLAGRLNVPRQSIQVNLARTVQWRDSSLGCPETGKAYLTVIRPGVLIRLEVDGRTYEYHGDRERVFYCQHPQPPLEE